MPKKKRKLNDQAMAEQLIRRLTSVQKRQAARRKKMDELDAKLESALRNIRGSSKRRAGSKKRKRSKKRAGAKKRAAPAGGKLTGAAKTAFVRRMALGRARAKRKR